jgi:hypothetical protein
MRKLRLKMRGGASASASAICPQGFHCMDTGTVLLLLLGAVIVAAIVVFVLKAYGFIGVPMQMEAAKPTVVIVKQDAPPIYQEAPADPRFNPMPPEQSYGMPPDFRGYPSRPMGGAVQINAMTRGQPQQYQQIGLLTTPGGTETSGTPTRTILPLFGRSIDRNRWNYYTRTDGINPVQVPVQFKRRNCDDDHGCDEISSGDAIAVPIMGQSFVATTYNYSTPRYLPVV